MHSQVHRPKHFTCPVCGGGQFGSPANAVQHVESGFCQGCRGKDNARNQIFRFASNLNQMQPYVTQRYMMIENGQTPLVDPPSHPYHCPRCSRDFVNLSQLMQHTDNSHGNLLYLN